MIASIKKCDDIFNKHYSHMNDGIYKDAIYDGWYARGEYEKTKIIKSPKWTEQKSRFLVDFFAEKVAESLNLPKEKCTNYDTFFEAIEEFKEKLRIKNCNK